MPLKHTPLINPPLPPTHPSYPAPQDVDSPLNANPDRAYSQLEAALGRLEALTEVRPAGYHGRYAELYAARDGYDRCAAGWMAAW